ncbi:MAG: Dabb family protein [Blastocatellia bacterium]
MHVHVAVFQWKPDVTRSQIEAALDLVRSVANRVPGIVGIYCGTNTSKWADQYMNSDVVVVVGKTAESIADYRADAVHVEAAKLIEAMEAGGIGLDFVDNKS